MNNNYIRFDRVMKRLLRDKSNYVVLEGFLSTIFGGRVVYLPFSGKRSKPDGCDRQV